MGTNTTAAYVCEDVTCPDSGACEFDGSSATCVAPNPFAGYYLGVGTCTSVCAAQGSTCNMDPLYNMDSQWCTDNWNQIEGGAGQNCHSGWETECANQAAAGFADPPRQGSSPCQLETNGRLWYYVNKDQAGNGAGSGYLNCDHAYFTNGLSVCYCEINIANQLEAIT